jgi:hypothetical protein
MPYYSKKGNNSRARLLGTPGTANWLPCRESGHAWARFNHGHLSKHYKSKVYGVFCRAENLGTLGHTVYFEGVLGLGERVKRLADSPLLEAQRACESLPSKAALVKFLVNFLHLFGEKTFMENVLYG